MAAGHIVHTFPVLVAQWLRYSRNESPRCNMHMSSRGTVGTLCEKVLRHIQLQDRLCNQIAAACCKNAEVEVVRSW